MPDSEFCKRLGCFRLLFLTLGQIESDTGELASYSKEQSGTGRDFHLK